MGSGLESGFLSLGKMPCYSRRHHQPILTDPLHL